MLTKTSVERSINSINEWGGRVGGSFTLMQIRFFLLSFITRHDDDDELRSKEDSREKVINWLMLYTWEVEEEEEAQKSSHIVSEKEH